MAIFRRRQRGRWDPMPSEYNELAQYNAERHRGILHAPEHKDRMAGLQRRFDEWAKVQRGEHDVMLSSDAGDRCCENGDFYDGHECMKGESVATDRLASMNGEHFQPKEAT